MTSRILRRKLKTSLKAKLIVKIHHSSELISGLVMVWLTAKVPLKILVWPLPGLRVCPQHESRNHCRRNSGKKSNRNFAHCFSSKKVHSLGGHIGFYHGPLPVEQISSDQFVVCPTENRKNGKGTAAIINMVLGFIKKFKISNFSRMASTKTYASKILHFILPRKC